ncbi:ndufs4 NADH dehydrogenase Fe-S protein subunit [Exophiala xenobiotica]|uniref:NADH dehydrogenase [ubiquinone] iron-sulfur protein 4, mitochondrial n=1 Tax=Vermiconidia calcicola TaxID=1690605 RepID=A0AAV9QGW5_9PEZI|nr:ndufs4 NADH dehydrogenase Fe-S protein subunit [Exophiala xenobiotica]KAK5536361.1 ndufs4 NADH dehydrogenase Fe-S protein subunit [Chaetothyriales sp. CCFEE 6169]KAK5540188.1 ndufs4 NADH dehydrogenase Fe-S protein subunit [Vermiconidia calcicola]KAK5200113.1 ndufs4 NADH dehydrogenase Fe-S protein subunit [Exophiala xenobiotica]KAK5214025.1 ndufs4 NADH dehydrogenase Fe-S protein subunit [Exophiala xenobiotica]
MSFLRSQSSQRLSRACAQIPRSTSTRWLSSTPQRRLAADRDPKAIPDQASLVQVDHEPEAAVEKYHPDHQPDYGTTIDHGTSTYSPVPKRVMNGSEPTETTPAAVLSGAPIDLQARTVRIYKPVRPATQSGTWGGHAWRMDWDVLSKGHRWENPLMGWQSSGDFMQGTRVNFKSKEDAIAFAEKQGYEWYVQESNERRFVPKAYANNFLHEPGPLKHIKTK